MGKRYYCDFCDKRFPYNIQNLQKHNSGSQHLQLKHSYYAQYKGKEEIHKEKIIR